MKVHAKIHVMPSKLFARDGADIISTLRLSAEDAARGGFFDVETLRGAETTWVDEGAKTGDVKVRSIHWSPYDRVGVVNAVP